MGNKIVTGILSVSGVILAALALLTYFGDSTSFGTLISGTFNCLISGSQSGINLAHDYHCSPISSLFPVIEDTRHISPLLIIFLVFWLFLSLSSKYFPKLRDKITSPLGIMISVAGVSGIIEAVMIQAFGLAGYNGAVISSSEIVKNNLSGDPGLNSFSVLASFLTVFVRISFKLIILTIFVLILRNLGKLIYTGLAVYFKRDHEPQYSPLYEIIFLVLGVGVFGLVITILAISGILNPFTNWLVLIIAGILAFYRSASWARVKIFIFKPLTILRSGLDRVLHFTLIAWVGINILEITTPVPLGWDTATFYLNYGKNLAETGTLFGGQGMQFWSLFVSQGYFLTGDYFNAEFPLLLAFLGGILVIIGIFMLCRFLFNDKIRPAYIGALLFYTMPMVFFQSAKDLKMDPGLVFVFLGIISVILIIYEEYRLRRTPDYLMPALAMFFLGVAFSIKYTSIFFIFPSFIFLIWFLFGPSGIIFGMLSAFLFTWQFFSLVGQFVDLSSFFNALPAWLFWAVSTVCICYVLWLIRKQSARILRCSAYIIIFLIPLAPWVFKNASDAGSYAIPSLLSGYTPSVTIGLNDLPTRYADLLSPQDTPTPAPGQPAKSTDQTGQPSSLPANVIPKESISIGSSYREEIQRYAGYASGFVDQYLLKPWQIHINKYSRGFYVDIGFIWLASFGLFLPVIRKLRTPPNLKLIGSIALVYWVLWIVMAQGIIWYGMPGFVPLILLIVCWYDSSLSVSKVTRTSFLVILVIWFAVSTVSRFESFKNPFSLVYAGFYLNTDETVSQLMPSYKKAADFINAAPASPSHPNLIYRIGTFIPYLLENDFARTFNDAQLDTFTPVNSEEDQYLTTLRLALMGFRFIIIDLNTATIDQTPEKTLTRKFVRLMRYIQNNPYLIGRVNDPKTGIMEVEIRPELTGLYRSTN